MITGATEGSQMPERPNDVTINVIVTVVDITTTASLYYYEIYTISNVNITTTMNITTVVDITTTITVTITVTTTVTIIISIVISIVVVIIIISIMIIR